MHELTNTETAFLMTACQQAVLALGWLVAGWLLPHSRRAALHWAVHALLSGVSLALFVAGAMPGNGSLRAIGNLCIVASLIALQRGLWGFFSLPAPAWLHATLACAAIVSTGIGLQPDQGAQRIFVISAVLTIVCASTAWDLQAGARRHLALRWGALLAVPIAAGAVIFGLRCLRAAIDPSTVVALMNGDTGVNVASAMIFLVLGLAFQLTLVALVVAQLISQLEHASRFDTLTGLLNRRAMHEELVAEVQRSRRLGESFSLLMLDADHFKQINDTSGHAAGDRALQHLATLLAAQMRDIDRLSRWGGEEFVVMLPGTSGADARGIAERLRERVEALPARWQDRALPITISIGVARWQHGSDDLESLLGRADEALYKAKAAGRNRVVAEPAVPSSLHLASSQP